MLFFLKNICQFSRQFAIVYVFQRFTKWAVPTENASPFSNTHRCAVAEERYSVRQVEEHAIQIPSEKMEYFSYFWLLTLE